MNNGLTQVLYNAQQNVEKVQIVFLFKSPSCKLIEASLHCYQQSEGYCEQLHSTKQLGFQFACDLSYLMSQPSTSKILSLNFLEENLNIQNDNLLLYDNCEILYNQRTCESYTTIPSPSLNQYTSSPPVIFEDSGNRINMWLLLGIIFPVFLIIFCGFGICYTQKIQNYHENQQQQFQQYLSSQLQLHNNNNINQQVIQPTNQIVPQLAMTVMRTHAQDIIGSTEDTPGIRTLAILENVPQVQYGGDGSQLTCSICLDEIVEGDDGSTVLACMHWFHRECLQRWIRTRGNQVACPLCNAPIYQNLIT
eukprot:TRINITY_DN13913_c0_g1_i2.p1 TRINITY_DN13913_c0_g1~~TRINITY_DN13913_c0_g1_i2.p1  ORF type:complete len:307 (-),score=14.81 TRINITY_DN13913_c0_g1_i2:54-974(-)